VDLGAGKRFLELERRGGKDIDRVYNAGEVDACGNGLETLYPPSQQAFRREYEGASARKVCTFDQTRRAAK
jgi:hypothetical protein